MRMTKHITQVWTVAACSFDKTTWALLLEYRPRAMVSILTCWVSSTTNSTGSIGNPEIQDVNDTVSKCFKSLKKWMIRESDSAEWFYPWGLACILWQIFVECSACILIQGDLILLNHHSCLWIAVIQFCFQRCGIQTRTSWTRNFLNSNPIHFVTIHHLLVCDTLFWCVEVKHFK